MLNFFTNSEFNLQSIVSRLVLGEIKIGEHLYWNLFDTNNILWPTS